MIIQDYFNKSIDREIENAKKLKKEQRAQYIKNAPVIKSEIERLLIQTFIANNLDDFIPDALEEYKDAMYAYGFVTTQKYSDKDFDLVIAASIYVVCRLLDTLLGVVFIGDPAGASANTVRYYTEQRNTTQPRDENIKYIAALCIYWKEKMNIDEMLEINDQAIKS